jgi:acetyl esterase
MALHPQARAAVAAYDAEPGLADPAFDLATARAADRAAAAAEAREPVAEVVDVDADGVPCRLYRPANADGLVIHVHGGGFVFHDLDTHDATARRLANRAGMAVLSVGYRRAPEHRFPAAPDDVDTVLRWLAHEVAALGLDVPTYVHGDSAGANLALVAALRNPGRFAAVALLYPFLDPSGSFDSYRTVADAFDAADAAWYWDQYADPSDRTDADVAPLLSDRLGSLPPTLVVTAEHDPLRDEGEELVRLLAEAGVEVVGTRYLGQVHGFWRHPGAFDAAEPSMRQVAAFLRQHRD